MLAIAYLPPEQFPQGVAVVVSMMNANNIPGADRLQRYFDRFWNRIATVVSVFERPIRTNNICETFHLRALAYIGERLGLWLMLGKINQFKHNKLLEKFFFIQFWQ